MVALPFYFFFNVGLVEKNHFFNPKGNSGVLKAILFYLGN